MYSNLFSPQSVAELTAAMQTQFPKAIWETFYVTLATSGMDVVFALRKMRRMRRCCWGSDTSMSAPRGNTRWRAAADLGAEKTVETRPSSTTSPSSRIAT